MELDCYGGGEYQHGFKGVRQFYDEELSLSGNVAITVLQALIESRKLKCNELCLCGSGVKLEKCHLASLDFLNMISAKQLRKDLEDFIEDMSANARQDHRTQRIFIYFEK